MIQPSNRIPKGKLKIHLIYKKPFLHSDTQHYRKKEKQSQLPFYAHFNKPKENNSLLSYIHNITTSKRMENASKTLKASGERSKKSFLLPEASHNMSPFTIGVA